MARSYTKIDYGLRPAKHAERLMIVEALRRLERLSNLREYRYVGFGSPFFVDFKLLHVSLNIDDMISIESAEQVEERFNFNRPFACVDLQFGHSGDVLPQLDWSDRNIVWLDFDGRLNRNVLADSVFLSSQMNAGSVLLISVSADPGKLAGRAEKLRSSLGDYLPHGTSDNELGDWGTAEICHRVIVDSIHETLSARNHGCRQTQQIRFEQVFNFQYADGVKMLTVGGIFVDDAIDDAVAGCSFSDFDHYRDGEIPFKIETPNLTVPEMAWLDSQLPCERSAVSADFLPDNDVGRYHRLYRYLPNYRDVSR